MDTASTSGTTLLMRDVNHAEMSDISGGVTYFDLNLFGYSLAVGDVGVMVCKPGACVVVAWNALK